jgi:signal transduction histidine kinase
MDPTTSPRIHRHQRYRLLIAAGLSFVLTCIAVISAYTTLGRPFPSLLVDAYGFYSIVELPSWEHTGPLPQARHRLVAVNGKPLPREVPLPSPLALYALAASTSIDQMASLEFKDPQGRSFTFTHTRFSRFGPEEFLFFFVAYVLAAWVVLWSGGLVFTIGGRPAARRAYTFWSVVTFLLLISFYDYHTNAWLAPLFSASTVGIPIGALWLAFTFPKPPEKRTAAIRRMLIVLTVLGAGTAIGLVVARFTGWDIYPVRYAIDHLLAPSIATLAGVVLLRLRRSTGLDRAELITASWGLIATPLLIALVQALTLFTGRDVRHLVLPFAVLVFPLSIGYAMIRNNILEARVVLTPRMLMFPFILGAILLSVLSTYLAYLATRDEYVVLKLLVLLGIALFILVMVLAQRLKVRLFFPATFAFRSAVEKLSDRLVSLRDIPAIQRALEEVVVQTLPTLSARVLDPGKSAALAHLPPDAHERLARGKNVWTAQSPREQHLLLPMRSQGELRAVLLVAPKREAALFTHEDLNLLATLASMGALALHNAEVVNEIESIRRLEVGAAQKEKQLTLSALSEELCHEMVYPLNFLQDLLRRGASGQPLDEEDLSFARDEVNRMKRMLDSLRRLQTPTPRLGPLPLLDHVQRALLLLRELIDEKRLSVSVEVPPELTVTAEGDSLVQLLSNLLRNAAQATPGSGAIGISAHQEPGSQIIEVWDTGPGIPEDVAEFLFTSRRISTKKGGYGIGLTVVQRIAYSFRWDISFRRELDRTLFRLTLPHPP